MRLAIIKLSALGDIVHASFLPQIIKEELKDIEIDWFCEERFAGVLEYNPYIDNIIKIRLKKEPLKELKKILKYKKYDKVVDLQGLIKSAIISKILGRSYGFDKNSIREKLASFIYDYRFYIPYEENIIIRNYKLIAKSLNINYSEDNIQDKQPSLFFDLKSQKNIEQYLRNDKKNILIILGSSWDSKVYPKEKYLNIVNSIDANFLLSWGNEKEERDADFISENSDAKKLRRTDLNALKALVSKMDLIIGGDSGPTHFAWALNRPSITIYGPTPSKRNSFKTDINLTIDCKKEIDANNLDKKDMCIRNIDEKKIIAMARRLLNG